MRATSARRFRYKQMLERTELERIRQVCVASLSKWLHFPAKRRRTCSLSYKQVKKKKSQQYSEGISPVNETMLGRMLSTR